MFGPEAGLVALDLLREAGVAIECRARVKRVSGGSLWIAPGDRRLRAERVVALPSIEGHGVRGLPHDEHGFLPIDEHARVRGVADVFAAGDGTDFPVKQGGIATQQADAAAEWIAATSGATLSAQAVSARAARAAADRRCSALLRQSAHRQQRRRPQLTVPTVDTSDQDRGPLPRALGGCADPRTRGSDRCPDMTAARISSSARGQFGQ